MNKEYLNTVDEEVLLDLTRCFIRTQDRSEVIKAMVPPYCSSSDGRSLLFGASNDCLSLILSYLSIESICCIDIAVTNTAARLIWLNSLHVNNYPAIDEYEHCHESIRWLVKRDISPRRLNRRGSGGVRIYGRILVGLSISSLRHIDFCDCYIEEDDILFLVYGCPHLTDICLNGCSGVTDQSVISLGRYCPQLVSIDIGGSHDKITDDGLIGFTFAAGYLNVSTIEYGDRQHGCNLQKINVSHCRLLTDIGISAIAQHCRLLSHIILSHCSLMTDIGVSAIAQHCPLLSDISLSDCSLLTDIGVSAIAQHCPLLSHIDFCNCVNITDIGVSDRKSVV